MVVVRSVRAMIGRVFFGAWVTLERDDGERERYRIVGPDEFDRGAGLHQHGLAARGRTLLGKKLDTESQVQTPDGACRYIVIGIEY